MHYRRLKEEHGKAPLEACKLFFLATVCPRDLWALSGEFWATSVWATYALYDPSYQNRESFGFFVDCGNGYTTLLPSIFFSLASAMQVRREAVAIVGLMMYWQELYGTCVYLFSFVFNKRYVGKEVGEVLGFVGISNSLWFFFPIVGIYASARLILDGDWSVMEAQ